MTLYAGIDLHSNNNYLAIRDHDGKRIFHKKLKNIQSVILSALNPYKEELAQIAVESTFNWYWLVDMLMDEQYEVKLANPAAIQQYEGLKHADDKHDAFWLAEMLRIGILPTGIRKTVQWYLDNRKWCKRISDGSYRSAWEP